VYFFKGAIGLVQFKLKTEEEGASMKSIQTILKQPLSPVDHNEFLATIERISISNDDIIASYRKFQLFDNSTRQ